MVANGFIKEEAPTYGFTNKEVPLTPYADNDEEFPVAAEEDYKSKYLDLYDKTKTKTEKEKVSILDDVDFELELIHRDEINVSYIIQLLIKLQANQNLSAYQKIRKNRVT